MNSQKRFKDNRGDAIHPKSSISQAHISKTSFSDTTKAKNAIEKMRLDEDGDFEEGDDY